MNCGGNYTSFNIPNDITYDINVTTGTGFGPPE
jgi:hypothetical protein